MKNILLLIHDDVGQDSRLQAAIDLTRALDAHLSCIDISILPTFLGDYCDAGAGVAMVLEEECKRESKNKPAVERRLLQEGLSWDWIDFTGTLAEGVQEAATLADLIVLNRALDEFPYPDMRDVASRILMHTHKPIVAVPDALEHFALDRALIAWDGHRSTAAAMQASVPLLALAKEVEIFMVRDGAEEIAPENAAEYLARYGISASVKVIDDGLHPADDLIASESARWRADYIVMGAYGHGRLVETFGGVTKRMLAQSKLPLVLAH
ncbi:universal stress protein [Sphingomonas sp. MMS24-J13]|uniref:universal stress protein n=1 Tax=Sphingomonas sp. MMS24-J13 TaxID=3238686 RepID=UPI00384F867C